MTDDKRMASAAKQAVYYRNYRRARDRALIKLSHLHPEDYKELLEKEKVSDEQEGKTWIDLNGATVSPRIVARAKSRGITLTQADSGTDTNQGNNGGEA
jgi:hypothetical protein